MITLTTILIGIAASIFTEVVTFINQKINGTTLAGKGAWILAVCIAFIGGLIDYLLKGNNTMQELMKNVVAIYAVSEIFFNVIMTTFNLNVQNNS